MAEETITPEITPPVSAPAVSTPEPVISPPSPEPKTSATPSSPHRGDKKWEDMKGLFEKRDGKKPEVKETKSEAPPKKDAVAPARSTQVAHKSTTTDTSDPVAQLMAAEAPDHFDEKGKSHFKSMKEQWGSAVKEAYSKVTALEKMLADREGMTKQEVEGLKAELAKTKRFEHAFDIQSNPEFQQKYITPAQETFKALGETLKNAGYDPNAVNQIDWDNRLAVEQVAVQLQKEKGEAIASIFREDANKLRGLRSAFNAERQKAVTDYDKIIEEKAQQTELKKTEREGRIKKTLEVIYGKKDAQGAAQFDWLTHKQAPVNATDEQKAQIAEHNQFVDESRKRIEQLSRTDEPEDRASLAVAAELGIVLSQERPHMQKQIKELEDELEKLQGSRTMTKSAAKVPEAPKERYSRGKSAAEAFTEKFGG